MINNRKARRAKKAQANSNKMEKSLRSIDRWQQVEAKGTLPNVPDVDLTLLKLQKVYSVWKSVDKGSLTASTTVAQNTTYTFTLSDVADYTGYALVFDQYRIAQVQLIFLPDSIGSNTTNVLPLTSVIDYDDNGVLTSLGQAYDYETALTTQVGQTHMRTLNPQAAVGMYGGSLFTQFGAASNNQWVDTASSTVQYYGVKVYWLASPASAAYSVVARYLLQFRNSR